MKLAEVTLSGTTGNDTLTGSYGAEDVVFVDGLDGDDLIFVVGGYYLDIDAGAGNDTVAAMLGAGANRDVGLDGGAGDDLIQVSGSSEFVQIESGDGNNIILLDVASIDYTAPSDPNARPSLLDVFGGTGDDAVIGKVNVVVGGPLMQTIDTKAGDDMINLQLTANEGVDSFIKTGTGDDVVRLDYSLDSDLALDQGPILQAKLGDGDDAIYVGKGMTTAQNGSFTIFGQNGDDLIRIEGNVSSFILGGAGDDRIVFSTKKGSYLSDSAGGAGNDVFVAGLSLDSFGGGAGADVFVFGNAAKANFDQIFDFRHGVDRIDLSRFMGDATFVGAKKFSGDGAEVRFAMDKNDFLALSGDVNGDGKADWKISFNSNNAVVTASDLIL
jgi:Ca2+-binding RTX toxin-like protein